MKNEKNVQYKDLKAASEAGGYKDGFKKPLTCWPFVRTFEYGADSDGIGTTTAWCCSWKTVWM